MLINPERVTEIFVDCLFKKEEVKDRKPLPQYEGVFINGIFFKAILNKERVDKHKEEILSLINKLDKRLLEAKECRFKEMFMDAENTLWGYDIDSPHELLLLGIAIKKLTIKFIDNNNVLETKILLTDM